jgi:C4-dicarboxylate transporter DctQ subunit
VIVENTIPKRFFLKTFLLQTDAILSRIENIILVLTLGSMIFIAFLQVILRNFFSAGIIWGDILLRHLVLWVGFLGASLASRENRHINIDALFRILPHKWKKLVYIITNLFSAIICALLVRAAYVFVGDERAAETTLFLGIPLWLFMSVILIGFMVMTFRFFIRAIFSTYSDQSASGEN